MAKNNKPLRMKPLRVIETVTTMRKGYMLRRESYLDDGERMVTVTGAYTFEGHYLGNEKMAKLLIVKRGIKPQLRTRGSRICSIGFSAKEKKWYGWSHRAIFGFGIGHVVEPDDLCTHGGIYVGFKVKTLADAKRCASAFAKAVN